jgi:hypothetical protein
MRISVTWLGVMRVLEDFDEPRPLKWARHRNRQLVLPAAAPAGGPAAERKAFVGPFARAALPCVFE